jgi:hypothetical protein
MQKFDHLFLQRALRSAGSSQQFLILIQTVRFLQPLVAATAPTTAVSEGQALAREVARLAGQAGDIAIGQYETLATQFDEQIIELFEQARAGENVAGLLVDWVILENSEAVMELAAQETLQETEARKLVAEVLGNASDSDSDEDLDDEEVLQNVAATKEKVDYFVSLLQMAINAAPFHEVNP